jgi:ABC-type multidrug transport system fused ATPase/permease subunit
MRIVFRLLGLLKKYWKWLILAYAFLLLSTAASLVVPQLLKMTIDKALHIDSQTLKVTGDQKLLIYYGLAIVGISLLRGLFAFGQSYVSEFIGQKVAYDIRNRMYDRIQRLSFAFHDKSQTGQLMSRATQDVESVRAFVSMGSIRIIYILTTFISVCVILFLMNWMLTLISLACLPFIAFAAIKFGSKLRPIWTNIQQDMALMGIVLHENLSGIRVVKAFSRQRYESKKFEKEAAKLYDDQIHIARIQAFSGPLMTFMTTLASALIIWYGGMQVIASKLTAGQLTQFYFYLTMMVMPIRMLGAMVNMLSRGIASGQRIFEILDTESAVKEKPNAFSLTNVQGNIKFQGVYFSYAGANPFASAGNVLEDINLEAKSGEMVALLGATGSGKTTLVNLIPRFYDITAGSITIDGSDIRDVTLSSLRKNVGIVQQDVFLFLSTIKENIAYGAVNASMEEIIAAAKMAELHDFIQSLPQGYDTWVGERGITLSGGQKQRLAIARTLLIDPRILILDDSTSSVDTETEFLIQQALRELMKGRTTFVIAQRLQTVKDAHQIFVLDKGKIVERGTHLQLLKEGKIYPEIYELQLRAQEEALGSEVTR